MYPLPPRSPPRPDLLVPFPPSSVYLSRGLRTLHNLGDILFFHIHFIFCCSICSSDTRLLNVFPHSCHTLSHAPPDRTDSSTHKHFNITSSPRDLSLSLSLAAGKLSSAGARHRSQLLFFFFFFCRCHLSRGPCCRLRS